ncbi:DUF2628 domain-containing protein [Ferrovibrio sp. MS7]|jgi:hypothetical protein|uniref:DUF2628 domain-containing protein n=1 Tax=Ferrovibrio plantarum TaxID=3119164 RepID=UPI001B450E9D|nr:DUF2628 domain-containing protein [Ferrovibrio sp.]
MVFFTVHERPGATAGGDDIRLIASRFSWGAALFTPFWLLWHRLWLGLLGYLLLMLPLGVLLEIIDIADPADLAIGAAIAYLFGSSAAGLRRWTLERQGWKLVAVVAAQDAMEAELRYRRDAAYRAPVAAPASAVATPSVPMNTGGSFSALPRLI